MRTWAISRDVRRRTEDGVVAVLVALSGIVLLGSVALAVDLGAASSERHRADDAADAAALAAAQELPSADAAVAVGEAYAAANLGSSAWSVTVTTPYTAPGADSPSASVVHVQICRDVPTRFAGVLEVTSVRVCGDATAARGVSRFAGTGRAGIPAGPPGILVLGKVKKEQASENGTKKAVHTHGRIEVQNGTIQVDSKHVKEALLLHDRSVTIADAIDVVGGQKRSKNVSAIGPVNVGAPPMGDPLAELEEPDVSSFPKELRHDDPNKPLFLAPGTYGRLIVEHGATVTLQGPGVYVFNGIEVKDDTSLLRSIGAMIFNVGKLKVDRGGDLELKAMTLNEAAKAGTPEYAGIAFFQARCRAKDIGTDRCDDVNKAKGQKVQLKGKKKKNGQSATWNFEGAIYAPNSKVEIKGESEIYDAEADNDDDDTNDTNDEGDEAYDPELEVGFSKSLLIAGELNVGKGAGIVIDTEWPPSAAIPALGSSAAGRVALVE